MYLLFNDFSIKKAKKFFTVLVPQQPILHERVMSFLKYPATQFFFSYFLCYPNIKIRHGTKFRVNWSKIFFQV